MKIKRISQLVQGLAASVITTLLWAQPFTNTAQAQAAEEKVLNIYHWSDYMAKDTISNFEKEYGIKVNIDYMDNNEILNAKLFAGRSGYDLVVPTLEWGKLQMDAKLLKPLDKSQIPNWKNYSPAVQEQIAKLDPGNQYLVNWLWGYTTVGVNYPMVTKALGTETLPENPWDLVFKPEHMSKLKSCGVVYLDSASSIMSAALNYMGKDPFSTEKADYDAAVKMLSQVRPYIRQFSASGYIEELAKGNVCMVIGWSGDIGIARTRAKESNPQSDIRILVPKTGAKLMFDTMAIPADAKHPKNAHLFINYILRPEVSASLTNAVKYANPNTASLPFVDKNIAKDAAIFLADDIMKTMYVPYGMSEKVRRLTAKAYNSFKAS